LDLRHRKPELGAGITETEAELHGRFPSPNREADIIPLSGGGATPPVVDAPTHQPCGPGHFLRNERVKKLPQTTKE